MAIQACIVPVQVPVPVQEQEQGQELLSGQVLGQRGLAQVLVQLKPVALVVVVWDVLEQQL